MGPVEHLSARNAKAWAASPVGRLARIEVLVTVSCLLVGVLVLLGSGRRASRSTAFRLAVWCSLMLSYQAVSYTIGLMQSASFRNELVVVWGCFLLLLLGCADGIAAYGLNDSDQQARTALNQGLQLLYVLLLLLSYVDALPLHLRVALLLLWVLSAAKLGVRLMNNCLVASRHRALTVDTKLVADYVLREHESSGADYDAATMAGYRYPVLSGPDHQVGVTLDLVWQCKGRLLRSDDCCRRKNLCLSFAMFRLLLRRVGGFQLHEACLNKTRDFVKVGLLGGDDHTRMYRVLEVELGFLFDFFYARYPSPDRSLLPDTLVFLAVLATSLFALFSPALLADYDHRHQATTTANTPATAAAASTAFDIWLTRMVIMLFTVLESFQYLSLVFSDWNKVKMLCRYVRDETWQHRPVVERLLRFMCHVRLAPYWNNSVGQHCLLYACFERERSRLLRMPLPGCARGLLARRKTTHHRRLTAAVKLAIYRFLRSGGLTRIRNGDHTLAAHGLRDDEQSAARRILVWHVATTICDSRAGSTARNAAVVEHHQVATTLSAYCAYLMSSAPELLPGNSYDTKQLFRAVQLRAQRRLRGCKSRDDMYRRLSSSAGFDHEGGDDAHEAVLVRGNKMLGDAVHHKMPDHPAALWKVLADLWVEMLLSAAPSPNVNAHVQKLATGGELITHLWALLTHAGIIDKPVNRNQRRGP
ncbi:unnamed protein product [Urochloa humidicola]